MAAKKKATKKTASVSRRKPVKKSASKKAVKRVAKRATKKATKTKKAVRKTAKKTTSRVTKSAAKTRKSAKRAVRKTATKARKTTRKATKAVSRPKRKVKDVVLLEALLGSPHRARIMRLFTREPGVSFTLKEIAEGTGVPIARVRREALALSEIGLLTLRTSGGKRRAKVDGSFPFLAELTNLSTASFPIGRDELLKLVKAAGRLKAVVVAGVFTNDDKARVDLLVVADRYSEKRLARAVKKIEQQIAAELRWAGMETKEFLYRWKMFDRFVRDVTARPHERILQKVKF